MSFLLILCAMVLTALVAFPVDLNAFNFIFWPYFVVFVLPALYLHIRYSSVNAGNVIEIERSGIVFKMKNGLSTSFTVKDIERIELHQAATVHTLKYTMIESYHYAKVVPKNGQPIIVTCLMAPNVEKAVSVLDGVTMLKKNRFFCYV